MATQSSTPLPEETHEVKMTPDHCIHFACPETKKERDDCIQEKGEANCGDLIDKHKECLKRMGFDAYIIECHHMN